MSLYKKRQNEDVQIPPASFWNAQGSTVFDGGYEANIPWHAGSAW